MSNSSLVSYTRLSPNCTKPRNHAIDTITIHHMAGNLSVEACGSVFALTSRQASSNYGIGTDGRVGLYVDEANRSWCSSNAANDNRAVTIEVANDEIGGNWHVSDTALSKLIELCTDICRRNGIARLNFTGDKSGNLTMHKWFAATNCPGPYLESKFPYIASEANKRFDASGSQAATGAQPSGLCRVRKSWADAKSQKGAFKSLDNAKRCADANSGYTVYEEGGNAVYPVAASASAGSGFGGTYRCTVESLNVRTDPRLGYRSVASYGRGQTVVLDDTYEIADGYVWGTYIGGSGNRRWIAVGKATGKPEPDDYLIKC